MADMSDVVQADHNFIGCLAATVGNLGIPSFTKACTKCGADVLVSIAMWNDLVDNGVEVDTIHPRCLYTCMPPAIDVSGFIVTDTVRAELHAKGMTDADIDRVVEELKRDVLP